MQTEVRIQVGLVQIMVDFGGGSIFLAIAVAKGEARCDSSVDEEGKLVFETCC